MGNTACYAWDSACNGANKAAAYVGEHGWHTGSTLMHDCGDYASNAWETFKEKDIRTQCRILSKGGLEFISIVSGVGAAVSGTKVTLNATKIAGGAATAQKTTQVFSKFNGSKVVKNISEGLRPVRKILENVNDILSNPKLLAGKTPAQVQAIIGETPGWKVETLRKGSRKGEGWVFRQYNDKEKLTGQVIRWHPGSSRKGSDPYWRVTSLNNGKSDPVF